MMGEYERGLAERDPLFTTTLILGFLVALDAAALGVRLRSRSLQALPLAVNDYAALLAWV